MVGEFWASESPNRANIPFFLGLASVSSVKPTSSNFSSSSAGGALSKVVERMAGELMREKRESRDVRDGAASGYWIGERAEISWVMLVTGKYCM